MTPKAKRAIATIQRCIAADRVRVTFHFRRRLAERALLWADVLAVFDAPGDARPDGADDGARERWIVSGTVHGGQQVTVVCAIGRDAGGRLTVFVTLFWED